MHFGASPLTVILITVVASLLWFFGIHPSLINRPYMTVLKIAAAANITAFLVGEALPYMTLSVVSTCTVIGGTGCTLGLSLNALLFAKSNKYRQLGKTTILTSFCNISEPVIFGFPVTFNIPFLPPMLLSPLVCGFTAWGFCKTGLISNYNPAVSLPYVVPYGFAAFLRGGVPYFMLILLCTTLEMLIWYPFFRLEDKRCLDAERSA